MKHHNVWYWISVCVLALSLFLLPGCSKPDTGGKQPGNPQQVSDIFNIDAKGKPYVVLNGNRPVFDEGMLRLTEAEYYSPLDGLGRCGPAYAVITPKIMPPPGEKRGKIGMVKPSGWQTKRYDDLIKDKYLYNRCHLIGWQLGAENANPLNLITGTRYLNVEGMLPFENRVADYVTRTRKPVLYRVVPVFKDEELVVRGVTMEAYSLADHGKQVCFYVYVPNVQPGIVIDYKTGKSHRA